MEKFRDFHGYDLFTHIPQEFEKEFFYMARTGRDCYLSLCEEFGAIPEAIEYNIFRNGSQTSSNGFCVRLPSTGKILVAINIANLVVIPTDTYGRVIPHEVAHAFIKTIYPYKSIGHKQEWKDVMKFMGVSDELFSVFYPEVNRELDAFQNSL